VCSAQPFRAALKFLSGPVDPWCALLELSLVISAPLSLLAITLTQSACHSAVPHVYLTLCT
jgi:hypothetical protein